MTSFQSPPPSPNRPQAAGWNDPEPPEQEVTKIPWRNLAVAFVVLLAVFVIIGLWPTRLPDPTAHAAVGQPLPPLYLETLTGAERIVENGDLLGRVAVIAFWSPNDAASTRLLGHLLRIAEPLKSRDDFALMLVSYLPNTTKADLSSETAALFQSSQVEMPSYWDPDETSLEAIGSLAEEAGEERRLSLPVTLLVDRQGFIRAVWYGYVRGAEEQIDELTAALLNESTIAP